MSITLQMQSARPNMVIQYMLYSPWFTEQTVVDTMQGLTAILDVWMCWWWWLVFQFTLIECKYMERNCPFLYLLLILKSPLMFKWCHVLYIRLILFLVDLTMAVGTFSSGGHSSSQSGAHVPVLTVHSPDSSQDRLYEIWSEPCCPAVQYTEPT